MAKNVKLCKAPQTSRARAARPKFGVRLSFEVFGHASLNRQIFVASAPPVGRRIEKAYLFRGSRSAPPQKKPRAKAQTFQIVVKTSFRLKTENAGIGSGLAMRMQGGSSRIPDAGAWGLRYPRWFTWLIR